MDAEVKTTIVNVKNVRTEAWELAKAAANREDLTLGEWLSDAVSHYAARQAGAQLIAPSAPAVPDRPAVDLREVAALLAAMQQAGVPVQRRVAGAVNGALYAALRPAESRRAPMIEAAAQGKRDQWPEAVGRAAA